MNAPKMTFALHPFTKKPISPKDFIAEFGPNYQELDIFPTCIYCGAEVFTYGVHSINVTSRFKHFEGDSCISNHDGYSGIDDYDFNRADIVKIEFCDDNNLKKTYALCLKLCGKGSLPTSKFAHLCKKANKKNIWAYKNIQAWMIPYILLTLDDFEAKYTTDPSRFYTFRFVFDKTIKEIVADLVYDENPSCTIQKVFADSQKQIKEFQLSRNEFENISIEWISVSTIKKIHDCCSS